MKSEICVGDEGRGVRSETPSGTFGGRRQKEEIEEGEGKKSSSWLPSKIQIVKRWSESTGGGKNRRVGKRPRPGGSEVRRSTR